MEIRSRNASSEDLELSARQGMEGLHVWRLLSGAKSGCTNLIFDVVDVEPHAAHTLHRHPHAEQATYVLAGSGVHLSDGARTPMNQGDVVFVPAGEWHGFANNTSETVTILGLWGGVASTDDAGYEDYPTGSDEPASRI